MATTISYNDFITLQRIYTASSGGTSFSSNLYNSSAFDFFQNSCVINDAIYFGFNSPRMMFSGLRFYVGTAFATTSVTFVWEYYKRSVGWTALSGVTDGTSGFTNTGQNDVTWTMPTDSYYVLINGVYCDWIRVRISAISAPTEGGAQSTQIVTAANGAVTISDPGNTVDDFCEKAYQADVVGGWGVVSKANAGYYFDCHVFLGYSSDSDQTNLSDSGKLLDCNGLFWNVLGSTKVSVITLGTLVSEVNKTTSAGCLIKLNRIYSSYFAMGSGNESFKLYGCTMQGGSVYTVGVAYNCLFHSAFVSLSDFVNNYGARYFNVFLENRPDFIAATLAENALNDTIVVSGSTVGVRCTYQIFLRNLKILGATYFGEIDALSQPADLVFIDPESNTWDLRWNSAPSNRGASISRHYTFNLTVIDEDGDPIEGAIVTLKNILGYDSLFVESGRTETSLTTTTTASLTFSDNVWSQGDYCRVGNEIIYLGGTVSFPYAYNITRAQLGTSAAAHNDRQVLRLYPSLSTDSNGETEEAIVESINYQWLSGTSPGVTTELTFNPFVLEVRKSGYKTYTSLFTLSNSFVGIIMLKTTNDLVSEDGDYLIANDENACLISETGKNFIEL